MEDVTVLPEWKIAIQMGAATTITMFVGNNLSFSSTPLNPIISI